MDLADRRETYRGFGDTLARSMEMVGAPLVFGLLGHVLDRWLGTSPVLMLVLFLFAVVGMAVRAYYGYERQMKHEEARLFARDERRP